MEVIITKNTNVELKDNELEEVDGGERESFNNITIGDISGTLTSENKGDESTSFKVGFFPGLSGFP